MIPNRSKRQFSQPCEQIVTKVAKIYSRLWQKKSRALVFARNIFSEETKCSELKISRRYDLWSQLFHSRIFLCTEDIFQAFSGESSSFKKVILPLDELTNSMCVGVKQISISSLGECGRVSIQYIRDLKRTWNSTLHYFEHFHGIGHNSSIPLCIWKKGDFDWRAN